MSVIRLGTRASALALWQAQYVERLLRGALCEVELVRITTTGDARQNGPIARLGAQGVFTKEIQRALLDKTIDIAVHSLKDLPTEPVPGLILSGVPDRGETDDAFVSVKYGSLDELPEGALVGTGSLRRQTQLLYETGHRVRVADIRGNVETRLSKLDAGQYDAIVLAVAGLQRLGLEHRVTHRLTAPRFLPAVGQGAIALETRTDDEATRDAVALICNPTAFWAALAEREFLLTLEGGCIAPIGALSHWDSRRHTLSLHGRVLALDASDRWEDRRSASFPDRDRANGNERAKTLGREVAQSLLARGADRVLDAVRAARNESFR